MKFKKIILITIAVCAFLLCIKSIVDFVKAIDAASQVAGTPFEDLYKPNFFWFLCEFLFRLSIGGGSICMLHEITTDKDFVTWRVISLSRKISIVENDLKEFKEKQN